MSGLDVNDDGRVLTMSVLDPVGDDRIVNLVTIVPILARPGVSDSGDHMEGWYHSPAG